VRCEKVTFHYSRVLFTFHDSRFTIVNYVSLFTVFMNNMTTNNSPFTTHSSRDTSHDVAISVRNLSKSYRMYSSPAEKFKELLHPFGKKYHQEFWALKDISFDVKKGECVGIIGRNGSGKSTLLQLICGVLQPTNGEAKVNGRISALLELGAGFNREFTGRDNVYMNGSLMGFTKEEMDAKFQAIADFADIGEFIEQPVKTYSSGMYVRLAFACAVNVDSDILIVDEALSVGDALFQKRCFQKMEELISKGITMLFVSHDQETIRTMTSRAVLLNGGRKQIEATSAEVVLEYRRLLHLEEQAYIKSVAKKASVTNSNVPQNRSSKLSFGDEDAEIIEVKVVDKIGEEGSIFYPGDLLKIRVVFKANKDLTHISIGVRIRNKEGIKIYSWGTLNQDMAIWAGRLTGDIFWDRRFKAGDICQVVLSCNCPIGHDFYEIQAAITEETDKYYGAQRMLHWRDEAAFFQVGMLSKEYMFGGVCDMRMRASAELIGEK
jgi:lipopolysaccharide transport system ATP-binding protein